MFIGTILQTEKEESVYYKFLEIELEVGFKEQGSKRRNLQF